MINNVIDHRTNKYNVFCDIIFEPSCHDNSIEGATQFTWGSETFTYEELLNTTVARAIEHAHKFGCPTTMFIYDIDKAV